MFEEIKDAVSTREAASFYGLSVQRGGKVCCPFHNDKHPSMKVDQRFHCFGCGADGDVINFVQQMFSLDAKRAAFKLIDDFHLNIDTGRKESRHEKDQRIRLAKQKEREKNIRMAYAEELRDFRGKMADIYRTLQDWEHEFTPTREDWEAGSIDERYVCAVHNKDPACYILDVLDYGEDSEIYDYYKHREETVAFYDRRITEVKQRAGSGSGKGTAPGTGFERVP